MRRHLATLLALIALAVPAAADAPFVPDGGVPDYVVTMETSSFGRKTEDSRVHSHHAGWTRIDTIERGRAATRYFGHAGSILVRAARDVAGAWSHLDIRRGDDPSPIYDRSRFKTGETRTILGEACHVWTVMRATSVSLALLSCVTDDGIELWRAYAGSRSHVSSATATRIERRPVLAGDVRPPVEALDLKAWNESITETGPTPSGSSGDFEAVIESVRGTIVPSAQVTRTVRRHHPWTSIDERRADGRRTLRVKNEASQLSVMIEIHPKTGLYQLLLSKLTLSPEEKAKTLSLNPVSLDRRESVLGETCEWFDVMPNVMDAGLHECRTTDGIVLKDARIVRGSSFPSIATRLTRRPVAMSEVLPTPDLLAPRSWGLPE
jgi:hypothetical protein